eukprot:CAMPEP_0182926516 /NCGR_PEP_ID=MMETSP0105_2-20130417/12122_1 /TAXON_ID=81532 ORGANISM="Acanthoeca-like sp., Strain 10tr" /NCGR_SAMPLE_ID=MMETSP0105_2 /ASSEMBLY_ACC=CAM_ASM_000205 /LENGTH=279 /DNA_ID=CAMNT_0025064413 /DNA_START=26 /DNA_END=865 /DNA_ORIENTATION=-
MASLVKVVVERAKASVPIAFETLEARKASHPDVAFDAFEPGMLGRNLIVYGNLFYISTLVVLYFAMKDREPFELRGFMKLYNVTCVLLAGTSAYCMIAGKLQQPGFVCNPQLDDTEAGKLMAWGVRVFYYQKYWEFMDTFIFMLRKRYRQVSFLHVYHHSSITIVVAINASFDTNGDAYLGVMLNSIVHVLMYSHYFVSAYQMATPWKPYLTSMQLIQFVIIMSQSVIAFYTGPQCGFPDFAKLTMIGYMVTMLVLFGRFYVQSYMKPKKDEDATKKTK